MSGPLLRLRSTGVQPTASSPESVAFDRLRQGPVAAADLDDLALSAGSGAIGLARWLTWSQRAIDHGALSTVLLAPDGSTFAEFVAQRPGATALARTVTPVAPHASLLLSRFAFLHRGAEGAVLESPTSTIRADLSPVAAAVVAGFGAARSVNAALAAVAPELAPVARQLIAALIACGLLVEVDDVGDVTEDADPVLSQWELHDLLLHEHSRTQRTDRGRGATYRFAGIRRSPAALPAGSGSPTVAFEHPDLGALRGADAGLAQIMEARVSRRNLGPLDAARLGDFLYRTSRVRAAIPGGDDPGAYDRLDRPHPSAGGIHELTTYIAIGDCPPLQPGIYRYDGVGHGLDLVAPAGPDLDRVLQDAAAAASLGASVSPLVIILAADFTRLSWKYEGIGYALMLKNVGVLFMSMQLVATAMGLGSCPLGGGDSELFARAIGADWLHHTSVGEFLLGS